MFMIRAWPGSRRTPVRRDNERVKPIARNPAGREADSFQSAVSAMLAEARFGGREARQGEISRSRLAAIAGLSLGTFIAARTHETVAIAMKSAGGITRGEGSLAVVAGEAKRKIAAIAIA